MNINWKKLFLDLLKVIAGAIAGSTLAGCIGFPFIKCF